MSHEVCTLLCNQEFAAVAAQMKINKIQIMSNLCVLIFIVQLTASKCNFVFLSSEVNTSCQTPAGGNGNCIKISDCSPDNEHLYITGDGATTQFLR